MAMALATPFNNACKFTGHRFFLQVMQAYFETGYPVKVQATGNVAVTPSPPDIMIKKVRRIIAFKHFVAYDMSIQVCVFQTQVECR
ncbi:hypothetical protein C2W62_34145 [Candidatus Entotheonella serta]|nr:hypothetical protein C2W62_34145 [Candidatus Entotheonella serta]